MILRFLTRFVEIPQAIDMIPNRVGPLVCRSYNLTHDAVLVFGLVSPNMPVSSTNELRCLLSSNGPTLAQIMYEISKSVYFQLISEISNL